jgi:hypothetical protein
MPQVLLPGGTSALGYPMAVSFTLNPSCVLLQVREVALEAIERARRGDGPTLIEAETYRFRGHSLADPDELRSKEEKAAYAVRGGPQQFAPLLSFTR